MEAFLVLYYGAMDGFPPLEGRGFQKLGSLVLSRSGTMGHQI